MKLKISIAVLLVAAALAAGRAYFGGGAGQPRQPAEGRAVAGESGPGSGHVAEEGGATVQRISETYRLAPGAKVEVRGINGPVEIAAGDGDAAEVRVEARADDARALERGRITVEGARDRLVVRGPSNGGGGFLSWLTGRGGRARHDVKLLLPRGVELGANGINGRLRVGELGGALEVSGVNGGVEAALAAGGAEVSGVNGSVSLSLSGVGEGGVQVSGVNGHVELLFAPTVNADLDVSGLNGRVSNELRNATVEEQSRARFHARVGAGGPRVNLSGINGGVTLASRQ
jgi:hypothetical protein